MAVTHLLKQVIEALPGESFTKAWKCIEEIDAALDKAGPTALLAMKYCQEQHEERTAALIAALYGALGSAANLDREKSILVNTLLKANKKTAKKKSKK